MNTSDSKKTHFGFKNVTWEEKAHHVRDVFDKVASRYDIMNDVMSGGMHRFWKHEFVEQLAPRKDMHILDMAGGTGDIAFRIRDACIDTKITISDINEAMLNVGKNRAIDKGYHACNWLVANAENLPQQNLHYDAYTIAFGIRNVTDIPAALKEAYRVLKFGGRFMCLEFSTPALPILQSLYEKYSFAFIPKLGEWIAQDRDSYQYLVESIRKFPTQDAYARMIEDAGFGNVSYRNLSGGIVAIHSGWKL